jgi:hypothetical protein
MVQEYSCYYRDSSPVNDHQSDLDIRDDPFVYSHEGFCHYRKCWCLIPFIWNIRGLIVGIFIPSSISLPTLPFARSRDIPSLWPRHMLQHWMNLTEWAQSIFRHTDEQIPLLMHMPQPTPLAYPRDTFDDGWCNQSSPRCSDYVVTCGLRNRLQHFFLL